VTEGTKKATVQRYRVLKNETKISSIELSMSLKHLKFISFHTHQKMHIGTIFQIATLLGLPEFHQHANKSITLLGITQNIPKRVKREFHKAEATSQWRRSWSTDSFFLLHKQHLFSMTKCLFLRLSTVRILPRAANHTKKAVIEGAWVRYTHFQGKQLPSEQARELKDLTLNRPLLEETHQSLSAWPLLTIAKCNT